MVKMYTCSMRLEGDDQLEVSFFTHEDGYDSLELGCGNARFRVSNIERESILKLADMLVKPLGGCVYIGETDKDSEV